MKRMMLATSVLFLGSAVSQATVHPSHMLAYTDPGSGAMLWQILVSSGVLVGFYFSRLRNWMLGVRTPQTPTSESPNQQNDNTPA